MDYKDISKTIGQLREKLNLTQENLAKELGVAFSTINRWETGTSEPRGKAKKKIIEMIEKAEIEFDESIIICLKLNSGKRSLIFILQLFARITMSIFILFFE